MSKTTLTTVLGLLSGALIAANVDYAKLFAGDKVEISKAVASIIAAVFGWATKGDEKPPQIAKP